MCVWMTSRRKAQALAYREYWQPQVASWKCLKEDPSCYHGSTCRYLGNNRGDRAGLCFALLNLGRQRYHGHSLWKGRREGAILLNLTTSLADSCVRITWTQNETQSFITRCIIGVSSVSGGRSCVCVDMGVGRGSIRTLYFLLNFAVSQQFL